MHPEMFVLLAVVASITLIAYFLISSRHKQRMALLEYDRDISVFKGPQRLRVSGALKLGMFFLFGGIGLLTGYLFHRLFGIPEEVAIFSFIFITAGSGLVTYYFIAQRINNGELM